MFVKPKEIWHSSRVHSNYFLFWAESFGSIRAPRTIVRTVHTKWIKTNLVISISLGLAYCCTKLDTYFCSNTTNEATKAEFHQENALPWKYSTYLNTVHCSWIFLIRLSKLMFQNYIARGRYLYSKKNWLSLMSSVDHYK